jgi:hypothetical protein
MAAKPMRDKRRDAKNAEEHIPLETAFWFAPPRISAFSAPLRFVSKWFSDFSWLASFASVKPLPAESHWRILQQPQIVQVQRRLRQQAPFPCVHSSDDRVLTLVNTRQFVPFPMNLKDAVEQPRNKGTKAGLQSNFTFYLGESLHPQGEGTVGPIICSSLRLRCLVVQFPIADFGIRAANPPSPRIKVTKAPHRPHPGSLIASRRQPSSAVWAA